MLWLLSFFVSTAAGYHATAGGERVGQLFLIGCCCCSRCNFTGSTSRRIRRGTIGRSRQGTHQRCLHGGHRSFYIHGVLQQFCCYLSMSYTIFLSSDSSNGIIKECMNGAVLPTQRSSNSNICPTFCTIRIGFIDGCGSCSTTRRFMLRSDSCCC